MRIKWFFIWYNLNPHHPRMLCAKFAWNWPSGSGEEHFFKISSMYFRYFIIISPWKRWGPSFEQTWFPFCAKFGWNWLWFWRRWKCEKFMWRQQRKRNKFWLKKLTWGYGADELKKEHLSWGSWKLPFW